MRPDYKNWMPKRLLYTFYGLAGAAAAGTVLSAATVRGKAGKVLTGVLAAGTGAGLVASALGTMWYRAFDYNGDRQMARQITEGIAAYVTLPEGSAILDVGCGSGALTIALAKRNPGCVVVGTDRWGPEYAPYSKELCEDNADAEGVGNVCFEQGDAVHLPYEDESFDAVTSNYVYHNIKMHDHQELLRETLRVLKKGGTFAIHDIMQKHIYGDMEAFAEELRTGGYVHVELIDTTKGMFMSPKEAMLLDLRGSTLLYGTK